MKKKIYFRAIFVLSVMFIVLCLTACGEQGQVISFGEERFYGVKTAEEMNFERERERLVQVTVGESRVWTLTASGGGCVYEREFEAGTMQSLGGQQGESELIMGISAVDDFLYACVSCGETVQVRRFSGDGQWENVISIPWEEAPRQAQPTLFFMDREGNAYLADGTEIWQYSSENGQRTIYGLKEPAVFLQEKEPGVVEAAAKSNGEIVLYTLKEGGKAEKKWTIKLPTSHLAAIQTDDTATLALAVDNRILFVNESTGEIVLYFDSIAAGVSTDLLGGLYLVEEGIMYLVEQTVGSGGLWEELAAQSGPEGDRTVLVYGTVSLSETMRERVVSFNKTNQDFYITLKEYGDGDINAGRLQLQAAVTSGNGPDIIDLYSAGNYISYAAKGYLEDLEPYLLKEDFSDDIMWQVQDLYRVDGKICMLVPHFTVRGLAINPEYVKGMESWDFKMFVELTDLANKGKPITEGGTARSILATLLPGMQGEFINWEDKKAYFNMAEFVNLLELCKECEKNSLVRDGVSYDRLEYADKVMIMSLSLGNPSSYMDLHYYYGEDALPYGYPAMDGHVLLVDNNVDACGIYSGSKNKDGAWDFLQTLFEEDYQEHMTGYSESWGIRKSCWYRMWEPYKSGMNINGVQVAAPADEDINQFMDMLLNGNLSANLMNYSIEELVMEEAAAYFAGDRTAEETAENIQNRVQVMLEE